MKMMKRTVSFLLVLALLLGLVPTVSAAGVWDSGDCGAEGSNVTWTLYEDCALVIKGSGAMADYGLEEVSFADPRSTAPWYYETGITSVRVENGVTHVGDYAFYGLSAVESITIASSVRSIGQYACAECFWLTDLELGNGVTTIGGSAFSSCEFLEKVYIPDSVKTLGESAFAYCWQVTSLRIGTGLETLPEWVLHAMDNLTSVTIPANVKSIGPDRDVPLSRIYVTQDIFPLPVSVFCRYGQILLRIQHETVNNTTLPQKHLAEREHTEIIIKWNHFVAIPFRNVLFYI